MYHEYIHLLHLEFDKRTKQDLHELTHFYHFNFKVPI